MSVLKTRIQYRYDTEENWNSNDFIPESGEFIFYEGAPANLKIGDGTTPLSQLTFASGPISLTDIDNICQ